jgi:hypothetical protein
MWFLCIDNWRTYFKEFFVQYLFLRALVVGEASPASIVLISCGHAYKAVSGTQVGGIRGLGDTSGRSGANRNYWFACNAGVQIFFVYVHFLSEFIHKRVEMLSCRGCIKRHWVLQTIINCVISGTAKSS